MSKKTMRSIMGIITYAVLLVLVLLKVDLLAGVIRALLGAMKPFFLGFAIAFVLTRPCRFLTRFYGRHLGEKRKGLVQILAVVTAYVGVFLVVIGIFSFVVPKVVESVQLFASGLSGYISNLQTWANELISYFDFEGVDLTGLDAYLHKLLNSALNTLPHAADHVISLTGSIVSMVVTLVLAMVFSVYMLCGQENLLGLGRKVLYAYLPRRTAEKVHAVIKISADTFTKFVSGQLTEACILGGLCALGMLFIQADYAPMVGVIIGATALVPVAGAYIGAIVSAFLLLMVSPVRALAFLVFLVILQQVEGNIIYPRVVGTSIGLPGIWVLLAVTVGGSLFGLSGILLSVPVMSVIYTLLCRDVDRRTLAETEKTKEE